MKFLFTQPNLTVNFFVFQPKPRLLRKQKSASELETKITIPQIDDESKLLYFAVTGNGEKLPAKTKKEHLIHPFI